MQQEKQQRDLLIISDFINTMYIMTDEFAEAVEKRVSYLDDDKVLWVAKVVDYIDDAVEKMARLFDKAEGFIEKGSVTLADQTVEEIHLWAEAVNGALFRLEEIVNKTEIKLH